MARRLRAEALPLGGLLLLAVLVSAPYWTEATQWTPDGLFYEAQSRELRGESAAEARQNVFTSPLAADLKAAEASEPPALRKVGNPAWVEYSSDFYRRRWAVPAAAAAIEPVSGTRSLLHVSLLGYIAFAPLLYLLLRRRFAVWSSSVVTGACLLLPPLLEASASPLTDSWGLTLMIAALLTATLALDRSRRWLVPFFLVVLVLSFTRDASVVVVLAVAAVALLSRTPRSLALLGTGVAAAMPAPLIFGGPIRDQLAYLLSDARVPTDSSWGFIADNYLGQFGGVLEQDIEYLGQGFAPLLVVALGTLAVVAVVLCLATPKRDAYFVMHRAVLAGGLLVIAVTVNFSALRLELVFLPAFAVGSAASAELAARVLRAGAEARMTRA